MDPGKHSKENTNKQQSYRPLCHSPVTEGVVSLLEPFIDTVVICTMTALMIIITGQLTINPETGNDIVEGGTIVTATGASGAAIFAMAVVNITGLYFLMPIVKRELSSYMARPKSGEIMKFSGDAGKSVAE
nr:alanine:cation symporter family protein [Kiloniella sp. EL199]